MFSYNLNEISKPNQIKQRNIRAQRREIIKYFIQMTDESFNFLNPLLDGDLFKPKGRELALMCNNLTIKNICSLFINRGYDLNKLFVKKKRINKQIVYSGLFERVAEIRLAATLHQNGVIDLLDQLNLIVNKKFYQTNDQMSAGVVTRKYPAMKPRESVSTALLRTANCAKCSYSMRKMFDKTNTSGYYRYFNETKY